MIKIRCFLMNGLWTMGVTRSSTWIWFDIAVRNRRRRDLQGISSIFWSIRLLWIWFIMSLCWERVSFVVLLTEGCIWISFVLGQDHLWGWFAKTTKLVSSKCTRRQRTRRRFAEGITCTSNFSFLPFAHFLLWISKLQQIYIGSCFG